MPELPEVETTRRGIEPFILNKRIDDIIVRQEKLRYPLPQTIGMLIGKKVINVGRRAKYLLFYTETDLIVMHLGMSGSFRVETESAPLRKHDHVIFVLEDHSELRYHDPRRFGFIQMMPKNEIPDYLLKLAPEPLSDAFNEEYFKEKAKNKTAPVKSFIMDQKYVVGVGNIYANEALFLSKIHPDTAVGNLTKKQITTLISSIKSVLEEAIAVGGTTLKDFVNPEGVPGYFAQSLFVYGRAGEKCLKCHSEIHRKVIGQRATFWCPKCQPKRKEK